MDIILKNVSFQYPQTEQHIISAVNMSIARGCFIAVTGPNGAGKSTLIQLLGGLICPSKGSVTLGDNLITANTKKLHACRKGIGIVFQQPEKQIFASTVFDELAFAPRNMGVTEYEVRERVLESLYRVQLADNILTKSPFHLSGGQKRKVAIASVLSSRPKVLILDEPTAGLDSQSQIHFWQQVDCLQQEYKTTIILVSHNMDEVAVRSQYVYIMNNGSIVNEGTPISIFTGASNMKNLCNLGLDIPEITTFIKLAKKNNIQLDEEIFDRNELISELLTQLEKRVNSC